MQLLNDLARIEADVEARRAELEQLTSQDTVPDRQVLAAARLGFSRALREHLLLIDKKVVPALSGLGPRAVQDGVSARRLLQDYHGQAAQHVAAWPSAAVAADWNGYRRSAVAMFAMLRRRVNAERDLIWPHLKRLRDAAQSDAASGGV